MKILKLIKTPDIFTLFNALSGALSIYYAVFWKFKIAAVFLLIAVLFDWLDGKVARKIKRSGNFGRELDSLADLVSFGVAPVVLAFNLVRPSLPYFIIFAFFLLCGILRLARFNIKKQKTHFEGIAITTNGWLFPIIYFALPQQYHNWLPLYFLAMGFLMISSIKIRKVL